ncbi:hypothetical protein C3V43_13935 [Bacteroides heparinolyticus]|nr:hypothetical protein C3V43_13935 [Bacteroides heparinolyticus]
MFLKSCRKNTIFILLSFTFLVKFTEDAENLSLFHYYYALTLQIKKKKNLLFLHTLLSVSSHLVARKPTLHHL